MADRRKVNNAETKGLNGSYSNRELKESFGNQVSMKNVQFKYGNELFLSTLPGLGVILVFGGRPTLLIFCFGAISTYIFDVVGSVEVCSFYILNMCRC